MRVADFFCGAGGFSEGFRQAGFEIIFAIDKWAPAVKTYKGNKPSVNVIMDDVIRISELPDEEFHQLVPDTEVIIGSPPCVAFSSSNKSGKGDKTLGIQLLKAYLKIVARKKFKEDSALKYWILENVPNIQKYIKDYYTASDLGIEGDFILETKCKAAKVYNAKYFGAPTNRKRYLCGNFPQPTEIRDDNNLVTLREVLECLGEPLLSNKQIIQDCNYRNLKMKKDEVTDHQYIYKLQSFEWETAKRLKEDRGYMGKMSFPENLDNPARTVMATMSASSREAMILGMGENEYRLPTVREVATMMSFPIDYRFYGNTIGIKYTLVGNAVPPKLSYALAVAIKNIENEEIPREYLKIIHSTNEEFIDLNYKQFESKVEKKKGEKAKFKYHIPYLINAAYRVELTNHSSDFEGKKFRWKAEIHYSQGKKKAAIYTPKVKERIIPEKLKPEILEFIHKYSNNLCGHNQFQKRHCMTKEMRGDMIGPHELLKDIRAFMDRSILNTIEKEEKIRIVTQGKELEIPLDIYIGYCILKRCLMNMSR